MAFWDRFRLSRAGNKRTHTVDIETKSVIGSDGDPLRQFLIFGSRASAATPGAALDLYESSTAVSIPINKIAEKVANLTPIIMIGEEKLTSHPLLDKLYQPSPDFDQELFMRNLAINYLVTGECFFVTLGMAGKPALEIYPLTPRVINHQFGGGFIKSFMVNGDHFTGMYSREDNRFWDKLGIRSLTQIRNFSTIDNSMYRGRSKLIAASDTARQQVLGTKHNLSILEKGGRLSLQFHFENVVDDDDYEVLKERINAQYAGVENAGRIGVTSGGKLQIENMSQTNQDMDWMNAQELSARVLALTFDLPLPLLSLKAATMSNYQSGLEAFYDDAITPLSKVLYGGIQRTMFGNYGLPDSARLTYDEDKVPALVRRRNEQVAMRAKLGVETDNELRNMLGREDYPGGDQVYKPANLIPVGTDIVDD